MSGASTSSFISTSTITSSPSSCHCQISIARLVRNKDHWHFVCLCLYQWQRCCWYIVGGPLDLQGQYADTTLRILLFFPKSGPTPSAKSNLIVTWPLCSMCQIIEYDQPSSAQLVWGIVGFLHVVA